MEIGAGLVRQYSLCNPPAEDHRYVIAVLLDPKSRGGSVAMHQQVQQGDVIRISEPKNLFPLTPDVPQSLLFAGGIGITPILCMAEQLAENGQCFEMHYCTRSPERAAFADRIRQSGFADRVQFHFDDADERQRLQPESILERADGDAHLYVCGPSGFIDLIIDTARRVGWSEQRIHREFFSAAALPVDGGAFDVQIGSSGDLIAIPPDQSIVSVLAEKGIDIPVSCEQGICGTCLTGVLEGEPDHRDSFLTTAERERNDRMLLCCSRARSARLVLDL
ncbi:Flavodoxin reductases (ferredoxin-NADPH reductases) family 1 [Marinobacterium lacunae]|uniref:Flavodoxin reductases (Ferredoxin-NADPH reductases) family 1 n=1 Tax=Marinobacterium lacunae TaxID=1232683 RepID=A0A081FX33_9GAMM|nr:Flavodoxin reductases (ferredoxin-NADPH reductases) family 1 [Marinobacterium lacunae]